MTDSGDNTIEAEDQSPVAGAVPEAFDALFDNESQEWPEHQTSRGFRAPWLATILLALLLLSGGLWLGAYLQRSESTPGIAPNFSNFSPGGGSFTQHVFIGSGASGPSRIITKSSSAP
ncbi:MAG: hypothetical protein ACRDVC_05700 [Acidimicrobiales bacterium]